MIRPQPQVSRRQLYPCNWASLIVRVLGSCRRPGLVLGLFYSVTPSPSTTRPLFDSKNSGGDATDEPGDFCVVPCVPYPSDFTTSVAGKKQQLKKEQ